MTFLYFYKVLGQGWWVLTPFWEWFLAESVLMDLMNVKENSEEYKDVSAWLSDIIDHRHNHL